MNTGLQTNRTFQQLLIKIVDMKYLKRLFKLLDCLLNCKNLIVYDIVYVSVNDNNEKKFDNK